MLQKIRYRLAWNRAARLNRHGEGLIEIECQQQGRRVYFSTHIYCRPEHWSNGSLTGIANAEALNFALWKMVQDVECVELEYIRREARVTLPLLREAIRANVSPAVKLSDFGREVVSQSDRKEQTRQNYETLLRDLEKFRKGLLVTDVDYTLICRYDRWLRDRVALNTRISRLRLLRALMNEARRRDIIALNPFDRFRIQQMVSKKGFLTGEQVRQLERMTLTGRDETVRDLFLLAVYTGLRFSDIVSLRQDHISDDGWLVKTMVKTGFRVEIPISELFGGKAVKLIDKYGGDVGNLTRHAGTNASVNARLKPLLKKVGAGEKLSFHSARHTFATLLGQRGTDITIIQHLLGHQKSTTTEIYRETDRTAIVNGIGKPRTHRRGKGRCN